MSINFRFPNINGLTETEQLKQIKSYLHQLVEQLNWAMSVLESGSAEANQTSDLEKTHDRRKM